MSVLTPRTHLSQNFKPTHAVYGYLQQLSRLRLTSALSSKTWKAPFFHPRPGFKSPLRLNSSVTRFNDISTPPPPVSYLCLELRLALSLQLIFQLHSVLKLQLLAHIHFLWRKKIKLPHRLMLNFSFQLFFSTFMSSDFSFTHCSHENTTG